MDERRGHEEQKIAYDQISEEEQIEIDRSTDDLQTPGLREVATPTPAEVSHVVNDPEFQTAIEPEAPEVSGSSTMVSTLPTMNVRKAPYLRSDVVGKIDNEDELTVIDDTHSEWALIEARNGEVRGYVRKKFLESV